MQFQFLKICFRIISYYFFIRKIFNKTDIFEVFWREKKKYISLSAALRIFKSSQLMSSVHVSHTCHTFFRISCTERWNIQGLIVPKKLIRKFKGIVHYFICFPIPQQRIKAEKDFSYRKKILQLEKKYIAKDLNSLHNQKFYYVFMKFKKILLLLSRKIYHLLNFCFGNYIMSLDSDTNNLPFFLPKWLGK